ncbi:MGMT family protein [Sinomonas halotolerans]|uniref:MGMT family protein n=1 Tax=Sinomonas halotolerans TaxID=1644133 RepID=A0ABU9WWB8_9MICC
MREEFVEAVLAVVGLVPPGSVLAYGDVAELLGSGGPRQVGAVMSRDGGEVPWWRVVRASGEPPQGHERRALACYEAESTPLRGDPRNGPWRVDIARARWAPTQAELAAVEAVAELLASREVSDPRGGMEP